MGGIISTVLYSSFTHTFINCILRHQLRKTHEGDFVQIVVINQLKYDLHSFNTVTKRLLSVHTAHGGAEKRSYYITIGVDKLYKIYVPSTQVNFLPGIIDHSNSLLIIIWEKNRIKI